VSAKTERFKFNNIQQSDQWNMPLLDKEKSKLDISKKGKEYFPNFSSYGLLSYTDCQKEEHFKSFFPPHQFHDFIQQTSKLLITKGNPTTT
jgi:hypothetical protein